MKGKLYKKLEYKGLIHQAKGMFLKPESNDYKYDFSKSIFKQGDSKLRDYAQNRGLYIGTIADTGLKNIDLKKVIPFEFNSLTAANDFKWGNMAKANSINEYDFSNCDQIVDFARANEVRLRGHTLIWGRVAGKSYPIKLDELIENSHTPKEDLLSVIKSHIKIVVKRYDGVIKDWDVVNEPMKVFSNKFADYSFYRILGKDYIKKSFEYANDASSNANLILNEQFFYYKDKRAKMFLDFVEEMVKEGLPISGIGIQHHVMFNEQSFEDLKWFLEKINKLGLVYEITELDIRQNVFRKSANPILSQAQSYYSLVKTCIESGGCKGITIWGVSDRMNWYDNLTPFKSSLFKPNNPLLFDKEMNRKPSYFAVREALR